MEPPVQPLGCILAVSHGLNPLKALRAGSAASITNPIDDAHALACTSVLAGNHIIGVPELDKAATRPGFLRKRHVSHAGRGWHRPTAPD